MYTARMMPVESESLQRHLSILDAASPDLGNSTSGVVDARRAVDAVRASTAALLAVFREHCSEVDDLTSRSDSRQQAVAAKLVDPCCFAVVSQASNLMMSAVRVFYSDLCSEQSAREVSDEPVLNEWNEQCVLFVSTVLADFMPSLAVASCETTPQLDSWESDSCGTNLGDGSTRSAVANLIMASRAVCRHMSTDLCRLTLDVSCVHAIAPAPDRLLLWRCWLPSVFRGWHEKLSMRAKGGEPASRDAAAARRVYDEEFRLGILVLDSLRRYCQESCGSADLGGVFRNFTVEAMDVLDDLARVLSTDVVPYLSSGCDRGSISPRLGTASHSVAALPANVVEGFLTTWSRVKAARHLGDSSVLTATPSTQHQWRHAEGLESNLPSAQSKISDLSDALSLHADDKGSVQDDAMGVQRALDLDQSAVASADATLHCDDERKPLAVRAELHVDDIIRRFLARCDSTEKIPLDEVKSLMKVHKLSCSEQVTFMRAKLAALTAENQTIAAKIARRCVATNIISALSGSSPSSRALQSWKDLAQAAFDPVVDGGLKERCSSAADALRAVAGLEASLLQRQAQHSQPARSATVGDPSANRTQTPSSREVASVFELAPHSPIPVHHSRIYSQDRGLPLRVARYDADSAEEDCEMASTQRSEAKRALRVRTSSALHVLSHDDSLAQQERDMDAWYRGTIITPRTRTPPASALDATTKASYKQHPFGSTSHCDEEMSLSVSLSSAKR